MLSKFDLDYIFTKSRSNLDILAGNTIFLTGGTGYFGKWLLSIFAHYNLHSDKKIRLIIPSRTPSHFLKQFPTFVSDNFSFITCDLKNLPAIKDINYIIHAAADVQTSDNSLDRSEYLLNSKLITNNILNISKSCDGLKRILFTSSGAVYGAQHTTDPLPTEETSFNPSSIYGEAKVIEESSIINFCHVNSINHSIARCFSFIGAMCPLDGNFALGNFIGNGLHNSDIIIKGNGRPVRSFLYMGDLVSALLTLLTSNKSSEVYNIGSDIELSINELAQRVSKHFPKTKVVTQMQYNGESIPRYCPSILKARRDGVLKDMLGFDDSLTQTVDWFLKNA